VPAAKSKRVATKVSSSSLTPVQSGVSEAVASAVDLMSRAANATAAAVSLPTVQTVGDMKSLPDKVQSLVGAFSNPVVERRLGDMLKSLRATSKGGRGTGLKPVKAWLVGMYTLTSAANTNYFPSQALSPISVQDWSAYASIYDLCRVMQVEIIICPFASGPPTLSNFVPYWVAVWDPVNSGAYASAADCLTGAHHIGPFNFNGDTVATSGTQSVNPSGWHRLTVRLPVPKAPVVNNNVSAGVVGGWFGTSDTTLVIGYLKGFMALEGAGLTASWNVFVRYLCEFKERT